MAEVKKVKNKIFHRNMFFSAKPAAGGVVSLICGGAAVALLIICVCLSYGMGGQAGRLVGSLALTAFIVSGFGIYFGFRGFKEGGKAYLPCRIGVIFCGCVCAFVVALFVIGV